MQNPRLLFTHHLPTFPSSGCKLNPLIAHRLRIPPPSWSITNLRVSLCVRFQAGADLLRMLILRVDGRADRLHDLRGEDHLPSRCSEARGRTRPRLQVGDQLFTQTVSWTRV